MKKIEPFLDDPPMVLDTAGLELKIKGIQQDSLSQEQARPIAPRDQAGGTEQARLEIPGPHYYRWGINE